MAFKSALSDLKSMTRRRSNDDDVAKNIKKIISIIEDVPDGVDEEVYRAR